MDKMKKIGLLLIGALIIFTGCEKDDRNVPDLAKQTFKSMYSGASRVEWERKGEYYVAEFRHDGKEKEAWFDGDGLWWLTETDIPVSQLPVAIKEAINNSVYASWKIDDIDYIERKDAVPFYVVEVERSELEKNLYYAPDGIFIKETSGDDDHHNRPSQETTDKDITSIVYSKYPGAKIIDIDIEINHIEVDLVHNGIYWEMILDKQYNWANVPQAVKAAFKSAGYVFDMREDEVEQIVRPVDGIDLIIYHIELDREPNDIHLYFKEDGSIGNG